MMLVYIPTLEGFTCVLVGLQNSILYLIQPQHSRWVLSLLEKFTRYQNQDWFKKGLNFKCLEQQITHYGKTKGGKC